MLVEVRGEAVLDLAPESGPAVGVSLVLAGIGRRVDVSGHPGAAVTALRDRARRSGLSVEYVEGEARRRLDDAVAVAGAWAAPAGAPLGVAFGGAAMPLLGAAYDDGATPVDEVPAWARPILRAPSARSGAVAGFGETASRPVVRALAGCLAGEAGPSFEAVALGLIGGDVLSSDALARVLSSAACRSDSPLPDGRTIGEVKRVARQWGARRTERLLLDAAARSDGLALLVSTARFQRELDGHLPERLPNRLAELSATVRSRVRTAVDRPEPQRRPTRRRGGGQSQASEVAPAAEAARAAEEAAALPEVPHRALQAPLVSGRHLPRLGRSTALLIPADVLALHGRRPGSSGLEWVVPRTAGDLERWAGLLANCLGSFAAAAVAGCSVIVGLLRDGELRYALELRDRTLMQFVGPANRPVARSVLIHALGDLCERGIVDVHAPANRPWLAAAGSLAP